MTNQRYVIEADGGVAGLVVQEKSGFRFFAACGKFSIFDRVIFRSPGHAESACRSYARTASRGVRARQSDRFPGRRAGEEYAPRSPSRATETAEGFVPEGGIPYGWPFVHM